MPRPIVAVLCLLPLLASCGAGLAASGKPSLAVTAVASPAPLSSPDAALLTRLPLRAAPANALSLFIEPDDGHAPILNMLDNARTSIDLMIYLLSDRQIIIALENAVPRGVTVRVMLEEHPCCSNDNSAQRALFRELQDARVQVQWTNPAFQLTHAKIAVLDGTAALVMSQNLTKSSFTANREASIIDRDPTDVASLAALFAADWARAPFTPTDPNLVIANLDARQKLLALINGTATSLSIESEEMQDPAIIAALVAAQKRGVMVRYIGSVATTSGVTRDDNAAGRKRLAAGGVGVRVLVAPYVHTKTIVADGVEAFVGSENFSAASLNANREVGLLTTDNAIIMRLTGVFTKDWAASTSGA